MKNNNNQKDKDFELNDMYKTLFENNLNVLLLIDKKTGKIVHANQSACTYYQYTYDELTSLNINDINILSKKEIEREMENASLSKRKYFNFVHRLKNKELRRVEVNSTPIIIHNKQYLFSIISDVNHKMQQVLMITGLFFDSPNAMVIVDSKKQVLTANKSFTKLFGYSLQEIHKKPIREFILSDESDEEVIIQLDQVFFGEVVNLNAIRNTKDNKRIHVNIIATPYIVGNEIIGVLIVYRDITDDIIMKKEMDTLRETTNQKIKDSKDQLQLILNSTVEGIYGIDKDGNCTFCNESGLKMLGYKSQDELLGKNMHKMIHHSVQDGTPLHLDDCKIYSAFIKGNGVHVTDEVFWRKDGTYFDVNYYSYPQYKDGEILGAVVTFMDHTERKQKENYIKYLSYHDTLTGLYNRKYFEEAMKRLDKTENLPLTIIFGDANWLKLTNDIFGHAAGDEILKTTANVLQNVCGKKRIIARVGGDEFAIILPQTNEEEVKKTIKRIKAELSKEKIGAIKCSISIGYHTKFDINQDFERIMELAEDEMYKDKINNRKMVDDEMVYTIIETLHARSPKEIKHSKNVSELCFKIGQRMGKNETELRKLKDAGYLHDIGKIILDKEILNKEEALTKEEKKKMEQHAAIGYRILNLFDNTLDLAEGVLNHHEKWDGSGYPKGIKGKEIPLIARIIAVAEVYDAMTQYNQDKKSKKEALKELKDLSGIKFDPHIVDLLIQLMS